MPCFFSEEAPGTWSGSFALLENTVLHERNSRGKLGILLDVLLSSLNRGKFKPPRVWLPRGKNVCLGGKFALLI